MSVRDTPTLEERLPDSHGPRPRAVTDRHLRKLAVVYIRQSSPGQVRDHVGSTAVQRDLVELPRRWGWPEENIRTIESDLGVSATKSTARRDGFQELFELVSQGKVGLVVIREVGRLFRRQIDAVRFLDEASRTRTLVEANGKLYNPSVDQDQDLFLLMLEGLLAWRDAVQRSRMMMSARVAKARRGAAVTKPPVGYVATPEGNWIKDPDERVREAVSRLFDLYLDLGSLGKVVEYLRREALLFPKRRGTVVAWGPIDPTRLHSILKNPVYTGDYIFGRYNSRPTSEEESRLRPQSEWITVSDHHEPYVARET
jgi:DNA invertase Pin-like site-specific DNA recombinase